MFPLGMVQVGSAGASTITFSSIPSTYKHLQIRYIGRTPSNQNTIMRFNGDTGTNYSLHFLYGQGSLTGAAAETSQTYIYTDVLTGSTTGYTAAVIDILDYTSVNKNKTVFCQHYINNTDYHKGQNQVVDPALMEEKWLREVNYLTQMRNAFPDLVPKILNIDLNSKKLFLEIEGVDFWQQTLDNNCTYDDILPNWRKQMLNIFQAHKSLGIYKYSLHPSSYFVVNGKLKSINYFFCYKDHDPQISLRSVMSHISEDRQADLFPKSRHFPSTGIPHFGS
jgi:hypothetical protein